MHRVQVLWMNKTFTWSTANEAKIRYLHYKKIYICCCLQQIMIATTNLSRNCNNNSQMQIWTMTTNSVKSYWTVFDHKVKICSEAFGSVTDDSPKTTASTACVKAYFSKQSHLTRNGKSAPESYSNETWFASINQTDTQSWQQKSFTVPLQERNHSRRTGSFSTMPPTTQVPYNPHSPTTALNIHTGWARCKLDTTMESRCKHLSLLRNIFQWKPLWGHFGVMPGYAEHNTSYSCCFTWFCKVYWGSE